MSAIKERYELAKERIAELQKESYPEYDEYIQASCKLFSCVCEIYETLQGNLGDAQNAGNAQNAQNAGNADAARDMENAGNAQAAKCRPQIPARSVLEAWNQRLYADIAGDAYENCIGNPAYAESVFGKKTGQCLCWYYVQFRGAVAAAYEPDLEEIVVRMELFLETVAVFSEDGTEHYLKENIYYYVHDYEEERIEKNIRRMLLPGESELYKKILMESDFSDISYLYLYGKYITENEKRTARYLAGLPEQKLAELASVWTEGYRKGFELAGIDLSKKKTVELRYRIGFEPVVRQAVLQFGQMGLVPVIRGETGISSTSPNRQYDYDHRFDDALYLNRALASERLKWMEKSFEDCRESASGYAGPAVLEVFGEEPFSPEKKEASPSYTEEQEKIFIEYRQEMSIIQNRYIPEKTRSFTIIAWPIPGIGGNFEEIFDATARVNSLTSEKYLPIQQALIDALDRGKYVHVTGRGENRTDIRVQLHTLTEPDRQTNFENCLADVNIPLGEVFTSPVLAGTNGVLHVTRVYLNELCYENLELVFEDGMVKEYSCTNFDAEEGPSPAEDGVHEADDVHEAGGVHEADGVHVSGGASAGQSALMSKKYIKENIFRNRETLPVGEFAIGTNTEAFYMAKKYGIGAKLPILIAEKTGPHFAVGDTCYSMSEDVVLHNPDGKEIIAKENECSALRKTDPPRAYFNCHTDITIPYDELGDITVHMADGSEVALVSGGKFVLPGTEALNEALERAEELLM